MTYSKGFVEVVGPHDRKYYEGKKVFNVTSCSTDFCKYLSPMILGPCKLYKGFESRTMENAWQYSKVYAEHDDDGLPNMEYFKWANAGWNNPIGVRYPMGKGTKPLYSFWDDECLDYITARMKIYIPLYTEVARKTSAFQVLRNMYESGDHLILWDFDGRLTDETNREIIENPNKPLGHGFVIKMMLEGLL